MRVNRKAAHYDRVLARVKAEYAATYRPGEVEQRAAEIATLPTKVWKGVAVFQIRCLGEFGNGPHEVWVPEYLLWGLISVRRFFCPFHR